jgi:hypothetical protein
MPHNRFHLLTLRCMGMLHINENAVKKHSTALGFGCIVALHLHAHTAHQMC